MTGSEPMKILLADDDANLREAIGMMLRKAGYAFIEAADGATAVLLAEVVAPDLIVLDVMMGAMSGFDVCTAIRKQNKELPVLFLSAKGEIADKKDGYRAGGDDYLVKPFNEEELLLRIEALLKRAKRSVPADPAKSSMISVEDLDIDPLKHEVRIAGTRIDLTPKEFDILALMAQHPGEVFSHEDLIREVWGEEYMDGRVSIPVYVHRIREKIEKNPTDPHYLQTVWRVGYRLGD